MSTDSSDDAVLKVDGSDGSCVGLISPGAYSSAVIEADIDFPALPGNSDTIADWTSFWLTNGAAWPEDGELDAVEAEPVDGHKRHGLAWGHIRLAAFVAVNRTASLRMARCLRTAPI